MNSELGIRNSEFRPTPFGEEVGRWAVIQNSKFKIQNSDAGAAE
jgi:hypothetical protein